MHKPPKCTHDQRCRALRRGVPWAEHPSWIPQRHHSHRLVRDKGRSTAPRHSFSGDRLPDIHCCQRSRRGGVRDYCIMYVLNLRSWKRSPVLPQI